MSENLKRWNAMARPPQTALKQIKGGRLQGMTDVNPQWRYQAMTGEFGPIGDGWKYDIDKLWTEPGADGEVLGFAQVSVRYRVPEHGEWSDPIVGVGGNHLIVKESKGLRNNDECWKMAITDALSVALKMLGVAADIYAGLWDGSKYLAEGKKAEAQEAKATAAPDRQTKKNRVMPPEAKAAGAVFIEKVIPKSRGNQEWSEVVLSTGEEVIAREAGCITLATNVAQSGDPVIVAMSRNGKGKLQLDEIARWKTEVQRLNGAEHPQQATGAF